MIKQSNEDLSYRTKHQYSQSCVLLTFSPENGGEQKWKNGSVIRQQWESSTGAEEKTGPGIVSHADLRRTFGDGVSVLQSCLSQSELDISRSDVVRAVQIVISQHRLAALSASKYGIQTNQRKEDWYSPDISVRMCSMSMSTSMSTSMSMSMSTSMSMSSYAYQTPCTIFIIFRRSLRGINEAAITWTVFLIKFGPPVILALCLQITYTLVKA